LRSPCDLLLVLALVAAVDPAGPENVCRAPPLRLCSPLWRGRSLMGRVKSAVGVAAAPPLDKHEDISTPAVTGCARWPKSLRLLSSRGELVLGRCNSPNKCEYCARLTAVEWAEMFSLDALDGNAPAIYLVLTTGTSSFDPAHFYSARRKVQEAIRRRYPAAEVAWIVEATTGTSARSGGRRFPHWNVLIKNVPSSECETVLAVARKVWCSRAELVASPDAQWCGPISELGGLMKYLALHFLKREQAMPNGWSGHRVTATRGYFTAQRWQLRKRAQDSLRDKRELHRAIKEGADPHEAELLVHERRSAAERTSWEVVALIARADGSALARTLQNREPRHFMRRRVLPEASITDLDVLAAWRAGGLTVGGCTCPPNGLESGAHSQMRLQPAPAKDGCSSSPPGRVLSDARRG